MATLTDWMQAFTSGVQPQQQSVNLNTPPSSFDQSKWNDPANDPQNRYYRNLQQEQWNNFQTQLGLLPYQIQAQRQYGPQSADIQYDYSMGKAGQTADVQSDVINRLQQGVNAATGGQRASDVGAIGSFARGMQGGLDSANPQSADVRNQYASNLLGGAPQIGGMGGVRNVNAGYVGQVNDPLLGSLNRQAAGADRTGLQKQQETIASSELAKGGSLGTEEVNNIVQQIRGRGESSGLVNSNRTFANELLGLDSVQQQRLAQRMAQAQSTDAAGFGQMQGNREFGLGTVGQNRGLTGQNLQGSQFNVATDLAGQQANQGADQFLSQLGFQRDATNAGLRQNQTQMLGQGMQGFSSLNDPILNSFNRQVSSPYLSPSLMSQNAQQTQMGQVTNPGDAYGADLFNTNANAVNNAQINNDNISMAKQAGWMDIAGQLLPDILNPLINRAFGSGGSTPPTGGSTSGNTGGGSGGVNLGGLLGGIWNGLFGRNFQ